MSTFRLSWPIPNASSLLSLRTRLSCFSYLIAVAGVRKNDPATIVAMKGSPKRANGCRASWRRYLPAIVFESAAERNFLFEKAGIVKVVGICFCTAMQVVEVRSLLPSGHRR